MRITVSQGDQVHAAGAEVSAAEVCQVPAQPVIADFIIVTAFCLPVSRGKMKEGRQLETMLPQNSFEFPDTGVNLGTFQPVLCPFTQVVLKDAKSRQTGHGGFW